MHKVILVAWSGQEAAHFEKIAHYCNMGSDPSASKHFFANNTLPD